MARKSALHRVSYNLLALALTILLAIADAECKGGGESSTSKSSSGSGSKITKIKDSNTGVTHCYDEKGDEVKCPKDGIKWYYLVGGILGFMLACLGMYIVFREIRKWFRSIRRSLKARNRDVEGGRGQQTFDYEKNRNPEDSYSDDVPPPRYIERMAGGSQGLFLPLGGGKSNDPNSSGSTIIPPTTFLSVPEPARLNLSPGSPMYATATVKPSPMPGTTPARKNSLIGKFWNAFNKSK